MAITVAIIGSGPAGFYTADALLEAGCEVEVDLVERLPTPFGLIRGGVAPDHQTTKKVARKYEQTALMEQVRFFGNVEIGRDVSLAELRELYDAVVLAIGAPGDRRLTIPGAGLKGVHGSAAFVGWYNGHPDFVDLEPDLGVEAAVVIGNGNVAIDVARLLARSEAGLAKTDIAQHARGRFLASPIHDVWLVGRRGPVEAKFTNVELREMGELTQAVSLARPEQLPDAVPDDWQGRDRRVRERNLETLASFAANDPASKPKRVHFEFHASPVEILGTDRVEAVRFERTRTDERGRAVGTGETFDIPCGLVVAAIGYRAERVEGVPYDDALGIIPNDEGRIEQGLYAVGWIKRGPSGVIASNRPDGQVAAEQICTDFPAGGGKPGRAAFAELLARRGVRVVSYRDWQVLDEAEREKAEAPSPRHKFTTVQEMIDYLDQRREQGA